MMITLAIQGWQGPFPVPDGTYPAGRARPRPLCEVPVPRALQLRPTAPTRPFIAKGNRPRFLPLQPIGTPSPFQLQRSPTSRVPINAITPAPASFVRFQCPEPSNCVLLPPRDPLSRRETDRGFCRSSRSAPPPLPATAIPSQLAGNIPFDLSRVDQRNFSGPDVAEPQTSCTKAK